MEYQQQATFTLNVQHQIGIVTINDHAHTFNLLNLHFIEELREIIGTILRSQLKGLIFISAKPDNFIRGFDLSQLEQKSAVELEKFSEQAQQLFKEIEYLKIPTVAAINGDCYGLGLELALSCQYRIASNDIFTTFAMPQVRSSLLPFAGGTQRLPNLIGLKQGAELILTGNKIDGKTALSLGLIHTRVEKTVLIPTALEYIKQSQTHQPKPHWRNRLIQQKNRWINRSFSRHYLLERIEANIPNVLDNRIAIQAILDVLKHTDNKKAASLESQHFAQLYLTEQSQALRLLEQTARAMKSQYRIRGNVQDISNVAILGSGFLGAGIAYITAQHANIPVRIKDIHPEGILQALNKSYKLLQKEVEKGTLSLGQMRQKMQLITGGERFVGQHRANFIIEAVYEDLALKQQMVRESEHYYGENIIFATNTSTLSIAEIAAKAKHPENIIGFHYLSPVSQRKMVEIIPHSGTSEQTIATAIHFAIQQGKIPLLVADQAGFFINRILTPYLLEAINCIIDGETVEFIDRALQEFGFTLGPLAMIDELGLDILVKSLPTLRQKLGERFALPPKINLLIDDERKGIKNKRGFYLYDRDDNRTAVDGSIYYVLEVISANDLEAEQIVRRCILMMLNEAMYCLQEGIIANQEEGNVASVLGAFFPSFRGGIYAYIQKVGAKNILAELNHHVTLYGERFKPCPYWFELLE
ncbi:3-hydroxyacyl-CoA dehydrogenase/enoyl-CoA hydratase/3-hydroxybutyryl-CoA epimerase [Volucribacter psittacicida]|uniref:enoyl-CoA hydratase n=1 Tax=Volucribacter psittacicida TaxID=203482 RepID=A0A4R1G4V5_9PAST|nr:3-hydroxyacyl-CoA dehydrogenase NAD-binding domain-containing protein [Volucribacter psittacicida]TCK01811.1 3-hydroxyacyl-CoA dehydrogenase/enoyl-CoA hydratase/3-hydroxybutyryl-CoA epimerase [Volucribacter psittacicida]